mmetsp:Transcript_1892/g.2652  ORF Transcript_1892/g.2652 Transcript_1892/m.2652 type:complete len:428 (+) Transcript_1892:170-1453(+)|eukprot:CAMPEP_0196593122 /NCGR_PEP_ID=MMETSP1081-20130531/74744_1 /TAXON_ID=36882 /ORGANISM="Pyramimonas amylifera, Strain CCMP720" /LENGTH=427 /DNA_ID=CAMNT_0041917009 /DNA_START=170 /DNA_END=1453 /DNA_ORIENTATION=+
MNQLPIVESNKYGDGVPFGDPNWYRLYNSPYYKDTHVKFRSQVREFVDKEITPFCREWDEAKRIPLDLFRKASAAGLLPGVVGGVWPKQYCPNVPAPADWDHFHELILIDEICRCGSGGVVWGLVEGLQIGLPPILHFGSESLKKKVAPPCLQGEKVICLCISEPYAGSDVASLRCTAKREGDVYVVNGEKKWITNGMFADYFTVAVRTGGPGKDGLSMLLVEKSMGGVECTQMHCTGVWASGTAFVTFTDVRVPVGNLIGVENQGFKQIMYNFNHERWGFIVQANRFARVCLEESLSYSLRRRTFGKRLIDHQVIRWKLAEMARQVECTHAMLETLTFQMCTMTPEDQNRLLGGDTALCKVQATKVFEYCSRESQQIFGGASYVRGGQGEKVERLAREVRAYAIPGGSEEIMLDLGIKQALRNAKL